MKNKIRQEVKLSEENFNFIKSLKEKENTTFNEIINAMINLYIEKRQQDTISRVSKNESESHKIYIYLTNTEYEFLKEQSQKHGFSSVTKEVKFRLLNNIYESKLFNNIEMYELANMMVDLNKIGRNINQLVKILQERATSKFNFNFDNFSTILFDINLKINALDKEISSYRTKLNQRV